MIVLGDHCISVCNESLDVFDDFALPSQSRTSPMMLGALDGGGHHDHGYNLKLRSSMTIDHASHDDHNEVAIENEAHDDLTLRSCMAKPKQNASQAQ